MRGFPKHLNTKADYEYVRTKFSEEQWGPAWQALQDSRFVWETTGIVALEKDGKTDDTHRTIAAQDEDGKAEFHQQELTEDKNARLFRLGFTVEDVEKVLEQCA
jgi:hypothetical protein